MLSTRNEKVCVLLNMKWPTLKNTWLCSAHFSRGTGTYIFFDIGSRSPACCRYLRFPRLPDSIITRDATEQNLRKNVLVPPKQSILKDMPLYSFPSPDHNFFEPSPITSALTELNIYSPVLAFSFLLDFPPSHLTAHLLWQQSAFLSTQVQPSRLLPGFWSAFTLEQLQ